MPPALNLLLWGLPRGWTKPVALCGGFLLPYTGNKLEMPAARPAKVSIQEKSRVLRTNTVMFGKEVHITKGIKYYSVEVSALKTAKPILPSASCVTHPHADASAAFGPRKPKQLFAWILRSPSPPRERDLAAAERSRAVPPGTLSAGQRAGSSPVPPGLPAQAATVDPSQQGINRAACC